MTIALKASFKHVGLYVFELEAMVDFYRRWFGLTVTDGGVGSSGKGAFLSADPSEHHQLVFVAGRELGSKPTINQLSFLVADLTTLKAYHRKAIDEDVTVTMVKSHGNALSCYILDPDGNQIEIYCHTPWYVRQPMGKALDLSLPDDEIHARVEREVQAEPSALPREQWMAQMRERMLS